MEADENGRNGTTRRRLLINTASAVSAAALLPTVHSPVQAQPTRGQINAIGFDAFTIFNPLSVDEAIEKNFPGMGKHLATAWRVRTFEYCWLRTLNQTYVDLWQVLNDALTFAFKAAKIELQPSARAEFMDAFLRLKPWPDSVAALMAMRQSGLRLAFVSNLTEHMLTTLSLNAGIADLFEHTLSTDRVKAFKPHPHAYKMAEDAFRLKREEVAFAAFGGWDAAGAKSFGLTTYWVNRLSTPVEELGVVPDASGTSLAELERQTKAWR